VGTAFAQLVRRRLRLGREPISQGWYLASRLTMEPVQKNQTTLSSVNTLPPIFAIWQFFS
jgi:hypothetical protein